MRKCKVFVGNSHPELGNLVCAKLGVEPAPCTLKKFANGETSVQIGVSVRDEDVYIIQSGSPTVNDHIMELLILVSACKSGSAKKITAVIPQFPYSKQSKMKKHRGAITARMLANLLIMAGADHVVSMDLHASQMQGFFTKPVDNLYGSPSLAKWIKENVEDYLEAVVVSKNPGGTKRVTALADSLKINFAMIHTDRRRNADIYSQNKTKQALKLRKQSMSRRRPAILKTNDDEEEEENIILSNGLQTARIVKGHVVDDDFSAETSEDTETTASVSVSNLSLNDDKSIPNDPNSYALGGTYDAADSDEDDEPEFVSQEKLITLVGNVQNRSAIILDDLIDRPGSFISAAEHCRLNCGAKKVYVLATHGLFIDDCLQKLDECPYIDKIVVTNTYPLTQDKKDVKKLDVIDVSPIFAECIRRDHYGESISVLFNSLSAL